MPQEIRKAVLDHGKISLGKTEDPKKPRTFLKNLDLKIGGLLYSGELDLHGNFDGRGMMILPGHSICICRWKCNRMNGQVIFFMNDGSKVEVQCVAGKQDRWQTKLRPDGTILKALYENGKLIECPKDPMIIDELKEVKSEIKALK
jgi:hypothetical protein